MKQEHHDDGSDKIKKIRERDVDGAGTEAGNGVGGGQTSGHRSPEKLKAVLQNDRDAKGDDQCGIHGYPKRPIEEKLLNQYAESKQDGHADDQAKNRIEPHNRNGAIP